MLYMFNSGRNTDYSCVMGITDLYKTVFSLTLTQRMLLSAPEEQGKISFLGAFGYIFTLCSFPCVIYPCILTSLSALNSK